VNNKFKYLIIEILIFLECFLARTNFDVLQVAIEMILIIYFLFNTITIIAKNNYYLFYFGLLLTFSIISFVSNPFNVFALNTKIYLLGSLSIIYFKYRDFNFLFLKYLMYINIFLLLYQSFFHEYLFSNFIDSFGSTFNSSYPRPLGLFLSPHESLNILAIYLLYSIYVSKKGIFKLLIIYFGEVTYVLFAFLGEYIFLIKNKFTNTRKNIVLKDTLKNSVYLFVFISFLAFFITINIFTYLKDSIVNYEWPFLLNFLDEGRIFGMQVILSQFLDYRTFQQIFTLIPRDFNSIQEGFWHFAGNEIMYFQLVQQFGLILFLFYFKLLLKNTKYFTYFIVITLFHYGDIITPLALAMLITYTKKINKLKYNDT
jgi:hypothetical protein